MYKRQVLYNGQVAFEDNVVFTAPDGTKIGVFGLDTPETATKAHPAKIQGVTFLAGDKMFEDVYKSQVGDQEVRIGKTDSILKREYIEFSGGTIVDVQWEGLAEE